MRTYDFTPLFRSTIGFDRLFDLAETAQRATEEGYPPYNIERLADDRYQITLAVAGFSPDEISITAEQNVVTIEGGKTEKTEREFLYRGISTRHFKRQFNLADYVQVKGASFDNGLLKIELVREIPEAMKPRRIAINGASTRRQRPSDRGQGGLILPPQESLPRVVRRAASDIVKEWRRPCGRRPLSTTMFSTSMRCCIRAPYSTIRRTFWPILRSRFRRNAPFSRPGHRMRRRSLRVPRCGHPQASRRPSPSTRYSRHSANSTAVRAIRLAASRTGGIRLPGSWPPR